MTRRIHVRERKLGRERAAGQAFASDRLAEIDPRQPQREYLDTLVHELLHILDPNMSEEQVNEWAGVLSQQIWKARFRRLEK